MYKRFTYYYKRSIETGASPKKNSSINPNLIPKLNSAVEILKENFNTEITREEIAERIGINPDTLGKIFKKYTGMTISDYRNDLRIHEAVRLLKSTDHNIIDIAFTVGFENLSSFYRLFQKTVGKTPNSIRDENTSDADI
jgi:transcriptional regulator GlxA family with amidase domain